jgi:hypothetical protein
MSTGNEVRRTGLANCELPAIVADILVPFTSLHIRGYLKIEWTQCPYLLLVGLRRHRRAQ